MQSTHSHWYYEDYIRDEEPKLPSLPLKTFSSMLFHSCPLLIHWSVDHDQAFQDFMNYKTSVPVCGAIMLNPSWTKVRSLNCRPPVVRDLVFLTSSIHTPLSDSSISASWSRGGNPPLRGVSPEARSISMSRSMFVLPARSWKKLDTTSRTR